MIDSVGPALQAFLAPQEKFDALHQKWRPRAGANACDLAYANPYDGPAPDVLAAIREPLDSSRALSLQYTPYGGHTVPRRLVANQLSPVCGEQFHWRDVVLTPGAMSALNVLFRALAVDGAGGEVIVFTPCWMDYPVYLVNLGLRPVLVPLRRDDYRFDLPAIRQAINAKTRAVVFSQPANPTGVVYSAEDLSELGRTVEAAAAAVGARPILVSDECHREVVFSPTRFSSPVPHYDRTCIVYSFGKRLQIQGQRIGYVAVSPRFPERTALRAQLETLCRVMGFCTPTALMQAAIPRLLDVALDLEAYRARRERLARELTAAGFAVVPSHATYFLYVRAPGDKDDVEWCEALAARGVFVLPASVFHDRGSIRLSVTASDDMVDRAIPILKAAT